MSAPPAAQDRGAGRAPGFSSASRTLRLGAVSYLNAEPLVYGLQNEAGFRLERDLPSRVAERLHAGEVDLGMIPSIEYAFGDYAIVPGVAIGSRGPVRSVNLFHPGPVEAIRRVALDTSSRTSLALVKVLLHQRLGRDPEYLPMPPSLPDMLKAADAALLIGDPSFYFEGEIPRLDLGEEWARVTGLPRGRGARWRRPRCGGSRRRFVRAWPRSRLSPGATMAGAPAMRRRTRRICGRTSSTTSGRPRRRACGSSTAGPTPSGSSRGSRS